MIQYALEFLYVLFAQPFQWIAVFVAGAVGMALFMATLVHLLNGDES